MSTYTREPGYIYIETDAEKRAAEPKLATDERWDNASGAWGPCNMDVPDFALFNVYRRRVAPVAETVPETVRHDPYEARILEVIDERDAAEQSLSQAYYLVIGESPEWSNNFGHQQALDEIDDALKLLRQVAKEQASQPDLVRLARELILKHEKFMALFLTSEDVTPHKLHRLALEVESAAKSIAAALPKEGSK